MKCQNKSLTTRKPKRSGGPSKPFPTRKDKLFVLSSVPSISVLTKNFSFCLITFLFPDQPIQGHILLLLGCVSRCNSTLLRHLHRLSNPFCPVAFQLRYWSRSEKEDMASVQRTVGNQTSTVIHGVKGSTTYYISVRAYNTAGTGPPSSTVNVTTKKPRKYLIKLSVISTQVILYLM